MPRPKQPKITSVLVNLALAGNQAAFVELVHLVQLCIHWRIARTLLLARRTCGDDICEVRQLTIVALFVDNDGKLARSWDPLRGSFENFARLKAKQTAIEFLRKHEPPSFDPIDSPESNVDNRLSPEAQVVTKELLEKALKVLLEKQTSHKSRLLFEHLIVKEQSTAQVRALMPNMTVDAIDQQRKRLHGRLKKILADLEGER